MSNKVAHLNILVDLLDQVNRSDVYAKRWGISIAAVFLALATQQPGFRVAYIAIFPIVLLWYLDAQNYRREALLRELYDEVRSRGEGEIDFSINIEHAPGAGTPGWFFMFYPNALMFYGSVLVGIVVADYFIM